MAAVPGVIGSTNLAIEVIELILLVTCNCHMIKLCKVDTTKRGESR
jgi:hypothetical protein